MPKDREEVRQLRAFVVDDERLQLPWNCEIEICRPPGSGVTKESSASGWYPHVEDIYRHKQIAFDLLSIDVFFTEDLSDPAIRLPREKDEPPASRNNPSGLVHGLAAMARREHSLQGNVMPLAFEVRTVSPNKEGLATDQWADVTRTYGLLLALMTPYVPDAGFLGLGHQPNPALAVRKAFNDQPEREGAALGLASLLPDWRKQFVAAVKAREVTIDASNLRRIEALEPTTILPKPEAFVAIIGRRGQICDRISLRSIFTDLALADKPNYLEVTKWISQLVQIVDNLVGYADETAHWVEYLVPDGEPAKPGAISPDEGPDYWEKIGHSRQSLALVTFKVASILSPNRFPPFSSQKKLAHALGVENFNENKMKRIFQGADGHVHVETATELTEDFLERLADRDLDAPFSPMFVRALALSLDNLGLKEMMQLRAPSLASALEAG